MPAHQTRGIDPFSGRHPTSHERLTGLPWDASYHDGPAPWDTGQPQPAIVRLASEGGFAGAVLDAGCGTVQNALHVPPWDCRFWALTWRRRHWRSPERRPRTVGSRWSSLRLTCSSWSVWGASLRRCWTADCSTPSTATSNQDTWRVSRRRPSTMETCTRCASVTMV